MSVDSGLIGPRYDVARHELPGMDTVLGQAGDGVLFYGAGGANFDHMSHAVHELSLDHPVYGTDFVRPDTPNYPIPAENFFITNTDEGEQGLRHLMESGIHAAYLSLPPDVHVPKIRQCLDYAAHGLLDVIVVAKPVVSSVEEMREVDTAHKAALASRAKLFGRQPETTQEKSLIWGHEHYPKKTAWRTLYERLGGVTEELGVLREVVIDIEEDSTPEKEGRLGALRGGAWLDLGAHEMSLLLDVGYAITKGSKHYTIPNRYQAGVQRFRYADSELAPDVETAFVVTGTAQIIDNRLGGATDDINYVLRGGKGVQPRKEAKLTFEDHNTAARSIVRVDFQGNTLDVPKAVQHLFPAPGASDNGYGIVLDGLNGGDPDRCFQHWKQVRTVAKWGADLAFRGHQTALIEHPMGASLEEL